MTPLDGWALARLLAGESVNGELQAVSPSFQPLAAHLAALDVAIRQTAFRGFLCGVPNADAMVKALAEIDATGPPPSPEPSERCATLEDVRRLVADEQWVWKGWLACG